MKKVMILTILFALLNSATQALTVEQQQEALNQLQIARAEINTIKGLVPGFLKSTIGRNLKNADERIAYAQGVLAQPFSESQQPHPRHPNHRFNDRICTMRESSYFINDKVVDSADHIHIAFGTKVKIVNFEHVYYKGESRDGVSVVIIEDPLHRSNVQNMYKLWTYKSTFEDDCK